MQDPVNLRVAAATEELAAWVYQATRSFPRDERFSLTAQMRRAAVSIGSNIFEGCGRRTNKELIAFLYIAHGSCSELAFQLRLARRNEFLEEPAAADLTRMLSEVRRMLSKLIRELERRPR
jgi:four helix bundle protein